MALYQNEIIGDEIILKNGFWRHDRVAQVVCRSYLDSLSSEEGTVGTQQQKPCTHKAGIFWCKLFLDSHKHNI